MGAKREGWSRSQEFVGGRLRRLLCAVIGHRYFVAEHISPVCRKVGCRRCGRAWGMHDTVRAFVPWDGDLQALKVAVQAQAPVRQP